MESFERPFVTSTTAIQDYTGIETSQFVGHNIQEDLSKLRQHGFDTSNYPFVVGVVDTKIIAYNYNGEGCTCPHQDPILHHALINLLEVISISFKLQ